MSDFGVSRVFRSTFPRADDASFRTNAWREQARTDAPLEPLYPTLLHALAHAAKADATTGLTFLAEREGGPEVRESYRSLYHRARRMAAALVALGVTPGDTVLLVLPTSAELVAGFFAVQLAGAVPVPSYPPATLERIEPALERLGHLARTSGARLCLTTSSLRPLLGGLALDGAVSRIVAADGLAATTAGNPPRARPRADDPALIQYTSGSTGRPRGVLLPHRSIIANVHAIGHAVRIGRGDAVVSWLPLYHDMGLIGALLFSIYWRLPLALMSPTAFLADPLRWLRTIDRFRATLSPAPNFAYAMCARRARREDPGRIDLSTWRVALNGAEPVLERTLREFTEVFVTCGFRRNAMLPVYGLAEASLAVSFPAVGSLPEIDRVDREALAAGSARPADGPSAVSLVSVGRPLAGHRVLIVDEHGTALPDRQVGHVVVAGPSLMRGYYRDEAATAEVLSEGFLWTGDLGYIAAGRLFIAGRAKDMLLVRGRNWFAEDIERVAGTADGVRGGGVCAFGVADEREGTERAIVVCESRLEDEGERAALAGRVADLIAAECGLVVDEVVLAAPGTILKTPSGKPQRSLCRDQYLAGKLGASRPGALRLAGVFLRSGAGWVKASTRRLLGTD